MQREVRKFNLEELDQIAKLLVNIGPPQGESPDSYFVKLLFKGDPPPDEPFSWPKEAWSEWNNFQARYFSALRDGGKDMGDDEIWDALLASEANPDAMKRLTWPDLALRLQTTAHFARMRIETKGFRIEGLPHHRKIVNVVCVECRSWFPYKKGDKYYCEECKR